MLALATMFHQLLTLTLTHNKLRLLATNRIDCFLAYELLVNAFAVYHLNPNTDPDPCTQCFFDCASFSISIPPEFFSSCVLIPFIPDFGIFFFTVAFMLAFVQRFVQRVVQRVVQRIVLSIHLHTGSFYGFTVFQPVSQWVI